MTAPAAFHNSTTPTISGTAGTQTADTTHSADTTTVTVKLYAGPTPTGPALQTFTNLAAGSGTWTVNAAALPANAQYTAQVTQTDTAGNSGSNNKTFVIDTAAPTPTITTPPAYLNSTTPTISGTGGTQAPDATHSADTPPSPSRSTPARPQPAPRSRRSPRPSPPATGRPAPQRSPPTPSTPPRSPRATSPETTAPTQPPSSSTRPRPRRR